MAIEHIDSEGTKCYFRVQLKDDGDLCPQITTVNPYGVIRRTEVLIPRRGSNISDKIQDALVKLYQVLEEESMNGAPITKDLSVINTESPHNSLKELNYQIRLDHKGEYLITNLRGRSVRAGYDRVIARGLVDKLNLAHRPNLEEREDGLYVCWGNHDGYEQCKYELELKLGLPQ